MSLSQNFNKLIKPIYILYRNEIDKPFIGANPTLYIFSFFFFFVFFLHQQSDGWSGVL